jgi:hypothetical protein
VDDPAHLDRAADPCRRHASSNADDVLDVVGLEEVVAAERFLRVGEWAVRDERLAVLEQT